MEALCYSSAISAISTNEKILGERSMGVKFEKDNSKTEGLVHIDRQTDGHG